MGKIKKFFSKTGWETSDFGGFSQLLWDLPELKLPYGFNITAPSRTQYISPYSERKLLSVFIHCIKIHKLSDKFLANCKVDQIESTYRRGSLSHLLYTFDKISIKKCVEYLISNEKELASLFVNYSNLLSNSIITYKVYVDEIKSPEEIESLSNISGDTFNFLKEKIQSVEEVRKSFGAYMSSSDTFAHLKKNTKFIVAHEKENEHLYSKEETIGAEKLLSMLDISFELDETKITNLRTGKIDMPKIAEAMAGNNLINFRTEFHDRTKPFSVCILNDESGSMDDCSRRQHQHHITKMLYLAFSQILDPKEIYIYGHTGGQTPDIHIYNDKYNQIFEKAYATQKRRSFVENYDGPVIDSIYDKIRSYTDRNILFIVISDGQPCGYRYGTSSDRQDLKRIVEKCKRDGFVTCGIGFHYTGVKDLYNYNTVINDMAKAPDAISMLINNVVKSEFQ